MRCGGMWLLGLLVTARAAAAEPENPAIVAPSEPTSAPSSNGAVAPPSEVTVAPAPTPQPAAVARPPQDIRVGDVIEAPSVDEPEEREAKRVAAERDAQARAPKVRQWYGTPILIGDSIAYSMVGLAVMTQAEAVKALALFLVPGTYLLTGPITHASHGNWGRASLSLGMRVVMPLGGAALGSDACRNPDSGNCAQGLLVGFVLGVVAATALDVGLLAHETVPKPRPAVEPFASAGAEHLLLGATGRF